MERQRIEHAIARIEAAAGRIEAAAANRRSSGDPELARKHEELRASVSASLRDLDTLIGSLDQ
ncbi:hypothetical protein SZ64_06415 [Erythrobacter sp. SG61-1L]|uniref:hypothetical protein n=1 Tax=Erythrobacter sp. SG61-1L TaxID=1603897 RepID=UPI0006C90F50|nr:hypothetical protein [Erythrobacter sp. SG61-1L]KPL67780.1 hypothetical protein SZ64_06415 [Erythrobacter sp. SG61-1L]